MAKAKWNPFKRKLPEERDLERLHVAKRTREAAREELLDSRRGLKVEIDRVQKRLQNKFEEYKQAPKTTKKIVERELRQIKRTLEGLLAKDGVIEKGIQREDATVEQLDRNISMIEQALVTTEAGVDHDEIAVIGEEYRDTLLAEDEAVASMKVEYGVEAEEELGSIEEELAEFLDVTPEKAESEKARTAEAEEEAPSDIERQTKRLLDELEEG